MPAKSPKNKGTVLPEASLVLIHGDDDFAVSRRARQVYHGWCEAAGGMDHETLDAAALNAGEAVKALARLHEALQTLPFFGGAKVVWFKDCNFLGDDRTAKAADVSSGLADLAGTLKGFEWDNVRLLISGARADKRKTLYKTLAKLGHEEAFEALSIDDRDWAGKAEQIVVAKLRALHVKLEFEALQELVQAVGPDRRALVSECEKLALYVGDRGAATVADVVAIVTRGKHARAFALGDALGDRQLPVLLRRLDEEMWAMRGDKSRSVIGLLFGLVSKVRSLLFAREMMDAGWLRSANSFPQFKKQLEHVPADSFPEDRKINPLSLNPYVLFRAAAQARHWTSAELVRALGLLLDCNRRLVSSSLDDTFLLQQALTQIVAREKAAA